MNFSPLILFGYYLFVIPYLIFLNGLFNPKYNCKLNFCLSVFSLFVMISVDLLCYENFAIRPFFATVIFFMISQFLYQGSVLQKVIVSILIVPAGVMCELPFDILVASVLQIDLKSIMQTDYFFIIQCILAMELSVFLYFLSMSIKKLMRLTTNHTYVVLALVSCFFASSLMISQVQMIALSNLTFRQHMLFMVAMFLISLICDISLLYYMKRLHQNGKAELTMRRLEKEYRILLDEYVDTNDEMYRYLRHDLMNYMIRNKK